MLQVDRLRADIEAAPPTADAMLAARRQLGLRFIVEVREGQSEGDVAAAFAGLSDRFEVRPLFASPPEMAGAGEDRRGRAFVAAIHGVAFDDVSAHPWDIAHAACAAGGFLRVFPDVPSGCEEPAAGRDVAGGHPGGGWEHIVTRLPAAWKTIEDGGGRPGDKVVIAHPDTGWTAHPIWGAGQPNLDTDQGFNFLPDEWGKDSRDRLTGGSYLLNPGHGTHVGAVIAAPKKGKVVGAAPYATLVPLRCITSVVLIGQIEIVMAVEHARLKTNCRVISLSLGAPWEHPLLRYEIGRAIGRNIIVVAAAGQSKPPIPPLYWTVFPAAYPECIAVAGVEGVADVPDPRDGYKPWWLSCRGDPDGILHRITISAPADPIFTVKANKDNPDEYQSSTGTSYATGFVAGAAALWLSYYFRDGYDRTDITAQDLFRLQLQTTALKPTGFDPWFYGMLNIDALISTPPPPKADATAEAAPDPSVAGMIADLLGAADRGPVKRLLAEALLGQPELPAETDPGSVEGWLLEISHVLQSDPALAQALSQQVAADALTSATFAAALTPAASTALAEKLAAPG
jgi:hypothetical protein